MLLIALAALAATGCDATERSVDVFYRAGHIVTHWSEVKSKELCTENFCTRTDTTQKYVGGHKGYTSETTYDYCPSHEPRFVKTGTRFVDLFRGFHFAWAFVLSCVLASAAMALAFAPFVYLFRAIQGRGGRPHIDPGEVLGLIAGIGGLVVSLAVYTLFFWF